MKRDEDDDDRDVIWFDSRTRCCVANCRRAVPDGGLYCPMHRRQVAVLDVDDDARGAEHREPEAT